MTKKCHCTTKKGAPCKGGYTQDLDVLIHGNVAYIRDQLPLQYSPSDWTLYVLRVCGPHRDSIRNGKAVNIQTPWSWADTRPMRDMTDKEFMIYLFLMFGMFKSILHIDLEWNRLLGEWFPPNKGITCGACKQKHANADEVKACYDFKRSLMSSAWHDGER